MCTRDMLHLKWRPKCFKDFIGNKNIVDCIINSLKKSKIIYNSYLFYGQRGVGKTTLSRLLSKSLNCSFLFNDFSCNKCISCVSINKGECVDVQEIDAASNTRVENIKEILSTVFYRPLILKYKIYIVDEVHMLSRYSFNALLKILEDTPSHVKFIFATTNIKKIPDTILSRCMSFFLKPIGYLDILNKLILICDKEKFKYELNALKILSLNVSGSMRDALVLLEQFLLNSSIILEKDVNLFFSGIENKYIYKFLKYLFLNENKNLIKILNFFFIRNINYDSLLINCLDKFHKLFIYKIIPDNVFDDDYYLGDLKEKILFLDKLVSLKEVSYYYNLFYNHKNDLLNSIHKKLCFEYLIFKSIYYKYDN